MLPDAKHLHTEAQRLADLIAANGMTIKATAAQVGVNYSVLRSWLAGTAQWPYTAQFAIESLAPSLDVEKRPDAAQRSTDPEYLRRLVDATGFSLRPLADRLGIDYSTLKRWLTTGPRPSKWPYSAQYALEALEKGIGYMLRAVARRNDDQSSKAP